MKTVSTGRREILAMGMAVGAASVFGSTLAGATTAPSAVTIPPIIDIHAHAILRTWRDWSAKKFAPNPPLIENIPVPDWNPAMAVDVMDAHGIEAMILSNPVGTKGMDRDEAIPLARQMNEEFAALIKQYPRFGAFAVLPLQDIEASLREIDYALDTLGLDGVCLPTSFEGAYPGDPRFEPILAELDRRRSTAFVHPHSPAYASQIDLGVFPGMVEFVFDSTRALVSLVCSGSRQRYPNFNYIASHGGGTLPFVADRIALIASTAGTKYPVRLTYDQVMKDLRSIHYDLAMTGSRAALVSLREFVPVSNILFGFDFPFMPSQHVGATKRDIVSSGIFVESEIASIAVTNSLPLVAGFAARRAKAQ